MKRSVRDTFFTVACAYFAYQMIGVAVKVNFQEWTVAVWANAILGIVIGIFGIVYGVRAAREMKEERKAAEEEAARASHEKKTNLYTMDNEQNDVSEGSEILTDGTELPAEDSDEDIDESANAAFSEQAEQDAEVEGDEKDDSL